MRSAVIRERLEGLLFGLVLAWAVVTLHGCTTFNGPNNFYTKASLFDLPAFNVPATPTPRPTATATPGK